jgi:perosamine synthetase
MSVSGELALFGGRPNLPDGRLAIDRAPISDQGVEAVVNTLRSGKWSMFTSPEVSDFETEFADLVGSRHAVLVNSCTTAILASLRVLGVTSGELVGAPAYTYVGTCLPILELGAKPAWIDISDTSQNMDPDSLVKVLDQKRLSAVIVPLLFGDERSVLKCAEICSERNVPIIFDCAQYLGNRSITSELVKYGPCCFSFGESKILRLGEGGAITTNTPSLAEALLRYRHEGESWLGKGGSRVSLSQLSPNDVLNSLASSHNGLNLRPLSYAAALGRVKIRELNNVLETTRSNAQKLKELLSPLPELTLPNDRQVWWTFPITISSKVLSREVLLAALLAEGVPVGVHFPRLMPEHPIFEVQSSSSREYFNASSFSSDHLVLPIYPELNAGDMTAIAEVVSYVLSSKRLYEVEATETSQKFLAEAKLAELSSGLYMFLAKEGS